MTRRTFQTIVLLVLAVAAGLAAGGWRAQRAFTTRGIPANLPPLADHGEHRLGLNVALLGLAPDALAAELDAIATLDVFLLKQTFTYSPAPDWGAADSLFAAAGARGMTVVPLLDGDPATEFTPPPPAAFAAWAGAFAARYGDRVTAYIIWDEPNLAAHWGNARVNPDQYGALLNAAGAAIRAADGDAIIVAAPLAPTTERVDSVNLADTDYLQALYESGATFDVVAAKPYGFDTGPDDRRVDADVLNFSRVVLLREVMTRYGDAATPIWAGNWGWNALPADWPHAPSIWGETDAATQAAWTVAALERARLEWPWLGTLFLENWRPASADGTPAPADDPRWGFSVAGRPAAAAIAAYQRDVAAQNIAWPGSVRATAGGPGQTWQGDWTFAPGFGADSSEKTGDQPRDRMTFTFYGTDVGVFVRRADFRARYYVTVDGAPANARPRDENGTMIVLDAPQRGEDRIALEPIARDLEPGIHTVEIVAERGWGQFALRGFSVGYRPTDGAWGPPALAVAAVMLLGLAGVSADRPALRTWLTRRRDRFLARSDRAQLAILSVVGAIVAVSGLLTWGPQMAGAYRRLGDGPQLALTAGAAAIVYIAPSFLVYVPAALVLFVLLTFRPRWGVVLVTLAAPYHVMPLLKPVFVYRFSPAEVLTVIAVGAMVVHGAWVGTLRRQRARAALDLTANRNLPTATPPGAENSTTNGTNTGRIRAIRGSVTRLAASLTVGVTALVALATVSLLWTERVGVAFSEWRVVIVGPALYFWLWRGTAADDRDGKALRWAIDAWVLTGVAIAVYGLVEYFSGIDAITAEGGLLRLRSVYGSPNNVALLFGRILPFPLAVALFGGLGRRRRQLYAAALLPVGAAYLLTFSKGGLFLGLPAAVAVLLGFWLHARGRRVWPALLGLTAAGAAGLLLALQIPPLAARLDLFGETSFLRVNLWRASWNMFRDHFWTGVGLDNFLYAYRGEYIFAAAWREPDLNHPHNIFLDFGTRLGIVGVLIGIWLHAALFQRAWRAARGGTRSAPAGAQGAAGGAASADITGKSADAPAIQPAAGRVPRVLAIAVLAALAHTLAHGLVDHSFFLPELAYGYMFLAGTIDRGSRSHKPDHE